MKIVSVLLCGAAIVCASIAAAGSWVALPAGASTELARRLGHARWIPVGAKSAARVVYVFTDPNCPYCNDLWKAMKSVQASDVQIRYVLVAVIDESSRGKDGTILESRNPVATFEKNERDFAAGGVAPEAQLQSTTTVAIAANERLMQALHIVGTPGLVYLDEHKELRVFSGTPDTPQLRLMVGRR
jgi:thiol:disulfide interchange protein DsbG